MESTCGRRGGAGRKQLEVICCIIYYDGSSLGTLDLGEYYIGHRLFHFGGKISILATILFGGTRDSCQTGLGLVLLGLGGIS